MNDLIGNALTTLKNQTKEIILNELIYSDINIESEELSEMIDISATPSPTITETEIND